MAYKAFFGGFNPFSINNFDRMVLKLSGNYNISTFTSPSESLSGSLVNNSRESVKNNPNIEYDPFSAIVESADDGVGQNNTKKDFKIIYCSSCGEKNQYGAQFCLYCGTNFNTEKPIKQEKLLKDERIEKIAEKIELDSNIKIFNDNLDGKNVLVSVALGESRYPTLTCNKTGQQYLIDKPLFRIGKQQSSCDLCINDNNFISRNHADIVAHNDKYYIVDRNSTNKTYIDDKVIPPGEEIEIFSGVQIRLANVSFIFNK